MIINKMFPLLATYVAKTARDPLSSQKESEVRHLKTERFILLANIFYVLRLPGWRSICSSADKRREGQKAIESDLREFEDLMARFCQETGIDERTVRLIGEEDLKAIAIGQLREVAEKVKCEEGKPHGNPFGPRATFKEKHNLFYCLGLIEKGHWEQYFR